MTIKLTPHNIDEAVAEAVAILKCSGAVLLVPTETVYGLVCRAKDTVAIDKIYELKDRDRSKKLALFIADWPKLADDGVILDGLPAKLATQYTPGAITIIAPSKSGETVGFRVPDHPFILALLKTSGEALASTSANLSGNPNVLSVESALKELNGSPDLVIDGGNIPENALASTVVNATGSEPKILRQGALVIDLSL